MEDHSQLSLKKDKEASQDTMLRSHSDILIIGGNHTI